MLKRVKKYIKNAILHNKHYQKIRWNKKYDEQDPYGYKNNPDDIRRKDRIIGIAKKYCPVNGYKMALDIGAGEGWITTDLPAEEIYGYDTSDIAMSRFPSNVKPIQSIHKDMVFDLIIATGVLYEGYGYKWIIKKINECASMIVITCNIKESEQGIGMLQGKEIFYEEFDYRNFVEILRVFKY